MGRGFKRIRDGVFVTGTDTGVGKTVLSLGLALALKERGIDVCVMKPVQCAGNDAQFLKKKLGLKDEPFLINPYYAPEPLAPIVAFRRAKIKIEIPRIIAAYKQLSQKHQFVVVEGIGGLLVPIKEDYFVSDLILDLGLPLIIVSRPGLGTINHTLLTLRVAKEQGLEVIGIIINGLKSSKMGIPEKTNPAVIESSGNIPILGIVPFLEDLRGIKKAISHNVDIDKIIKRPEEKSKPWTYWDKRYIWHPFTQMQDWQEQENLVIKEAKGCYLKDIKGKRYLDGTSSLWVNLHGHRKKDIDDAIKRQLNKVAHSTLLGLANIPSIELAKKLVRIAPRGLERVFYSDTGACSVEIALKLAFQYWQNIGKRKKTKFIHLKNSYHGDTIGAMSVGGIDLFQRTYKPLLFESFEVESPYCYRCAKDKPRPFGQICNAPLKYPKGRGDCNFACLEELERTMQEHQASISALIVEPIVQAAGGMIIWPEGALRRMWELCKQYNVLLIADEVATGFGRTGKMFACEYEAVTPDILCLAKGLSGGYLPLAATLTTEEIYNAFLGDYNQKKTFFHGHTYTGNPLACASALANLEIFEKEKTLDKLQAKIQILQKGLLQFQELKHVGDIRQKGFMVGIELVKDRATKQPFAWKQKMGIKVCQYARRYGVILRPLGNVIVLMPPLAISKEELNKLIEATYHSLHATELSPYN